MANVKISELPKKNNYEPGIEAAAVFDGATVAQSMDPIVDRANHTGTQPISSITSLQTELDSKAKRPTNTVVVNNLSDLPSPAGGVIPLDSSVSYYIGDNIDIGANTLEVPVGGAYITGPNLVLATITTSEDNATIFSSPVGGSGGLLVVGVGLSCTGVGSSVYNLVDSTGFNTILTENISYDNCSSLGTVSGYLQWFELVTRRIGGDPTITFDGNFGGVRVADSVVVQTTGISSIFSAGGSLSISGRCVFDINAELGPTSPLIDFSDTNIQNDESLVLDKCFVRRNGLINPNDTTIYPNINETNVKSRRTGNVGVPNTVRFISSTLSTEVETIIPGPGTYVPLLGTFTVSDSSHFDSPNNGEYRLLSGGGKYQFSGDIEIDGGSNDTVELRVIKSTDGGSTFTDEVGSIVRVINNLTGGRDVGFFTISFLGRLSVGDIVRLEVRNNTDGTNVTAEVGSYFNISEV